MSGGAQKLWGDVSPGRFAEAQKFADQGQWGQAAQQYQLGGGQFGQPQMQAFSQQYNVPIPDAFGGGANYARPSEENYGIGQVHHTSGIGGSYDMPGVPPSNYYPGQIIADGPGSDMWGPPTTPPPQAQPVMPPQVAQPMIPPPQVAQPTPPTMGTGGFTGHHNVSAGRLAEAQRLGKIAGVGGNMGLAKQQWELGGGKWSPDAHMFLDGRLAGGGLLS